MNTLLLGLAFSLGAPALKEKPKLEAGIVGEWIPEAIGLGGKAGPGVAKTEMRYQFTADGKWIISRNSVKSAAPREYKLDLKAEPKSIDVAAPPRANAVGAAIVEPKPMLGIWKIEGDELTICFSLGGDERPKSFDDGDGAGRLVLMKLRRVKVGDVPAKK